MKIEQQIKIDLNLYFLYFLSRKKNGSLQRIFEKK